jgi:hypothetical protein
MSPPEFQVSMHLPEDLFGIIGAKVLDSPSNAVVHLCLEFDDATLPYVSCSRRENDSFYRKKHFPSSSIENER